MKATNYHRIQADLKYNDVVLYLKGTAAFPMCGFSAAMVQILTQMDIPFKAVNTLEDQEIHDEVKAFSNWPAVPQLFVKGEFIGGSEQVRDLFQTGQLEQVLIQKGLLQQNERIPA